MNYHRFESILAASPLPRPRAPSTTNDGDHPDSDDNVSIQQPQQQSFRRSHSMRASFTSLRGLKTRLKHPVVSGYSGATRYTQLASSPGAGRESPHQHHNQHHHHHHHQPTATLTTAAAAAAKANVKAKLLKLKETYAEFRRLQSSSKRNSEFELAKRGPSDNFKVPENMPPKAAAVLLEGASRNRVKRSQSLRCGDADRYGVTIGGEAPGKQAPNEAGGHRLTVNRVSIKMGSTRRPMVTVATRNGSGNSPDTTVVRTATIRRSSVWANSSSSSKILNWNFI